VYLVKKPQVVSEFWGTSTKLCRCSLVSCCIYVCCNVIFFCRIIYFVKKIMDAEDLFRKLTSGAKFNFKKYFADAQKLKVCIIFGAATLKLCNRV
jgi:hypothetical protein